MRFVTGYDYEPGWGRLGDLVDRVAFRRLLGWATAWSFDRLRLWLEDGVTPERALRLGVADGVLRVTAVALGAAALVRGPRPYAVVALLAVLPPVPGAPRASRCRRAPTRPEGRRAPSTLATLEEPA